MMRKIGKVNLDFFKQNIGNHCGFHRDEVICYPQFGVDTSVISLGNGKVMISASDPLSYIPNLGARDSALLSIVLTSNDIATSGKPPQYAQMVLNLSDEMEDDDFKAYWFWIHNICREQKISIIGGHTGFVPQQNSTFVGGLTLFSIAEEHQYFTSKSAQIGDWIVMTKEAALVSTAILAKSFPKIVKERLGVSILERTIEKFEQISVLEEALIAADCTGVTAMHDATEGGILGAVAEMMIASEKGCELDINRINISDETLKMSQLFDYDIFSSVGAGSLILTINPNNWEELKQKLQKVNINASVIGEVKPNSFGRKIIDKGSSKSFEMPNSDSYWNAFYNALNKGWK